MPLKTYIDDAESRARSERDALEAKRDAIDRFIDRVEDLAPEPSPSSSHPVTAVAGMLSRNASTDDECRAVRRAFAETIRPHSIGDIDESESLDETIRAEFSESLAGALAPTTDTSFSPKLKRTVVSEATARRTETDASYRALEREISHLEEAEEVVDNVTSWLVTADETSLCTLDFDELRERHDALASCRRRCETVARRRQEFLDETTSNGVEARVRHRRLVPYLYEDFPVDHPVLATVARLDATCRACRRVIRDHLVRRV